MIDVSPPFHCLDSCTEVVSGENEVRYLLHGRAARAHGYAYICYINAFDIVDAVSCVYNILTQLLKAVYHHIFMQGSSSS